MNPEWNYGYFYTESSYGFDPATLAAGAGLVSVLSQAASTAITAQTAREQSKADERMLRLQMVSAKQEAAASQEAIKMALAKSAQESAAQTQIAKTVVLGLGAIAVLGALLYLGKDYLKAPTAA